MARTIRGISKIWLGPLAASVQCHQAYMEEIDVIVDEDENEQKESTKIAKDTTEQDKAMTGTQLVDCDTELHEEYKQLLVKAVALRIQQKISEESMWKEIMKETGFDHKIVWNKIRETTIKKIMRLLPANDLLENIPTKMQLSAADWLFFDLVLVHEQINVLNMDDPAKPHNPQSDHLETGKGCKEEPQCLQDLFELVKQHNIENLVGETLAEAWKNLTLQYNSRGRQCSPMMLQLRWYQLKNKTRFCYYNSYNHNKTRDIQGTMQSSEMDLTVLQIAIAVAYNNIITEELPTWETLIRQNKVILFEEFLNGDSFKYQNKIDSIPAPGPSNTPPVLLLTLDGNQMAADLEKTKNIGSSATNADKIVIDLQDDVEYAAALQNMLGKSVKPKTRSVKDKPKQCNKESELALVREVVKMLGSPPRELDKTMWQTLKKTYGRACKITWTRMRNDTLKKLRSLFATDDWVELSPAKQLSATEWLLFDKLLVHEKICLININRREAQCLQDLFDLVNEYQVENLSGEKLVEAWIDLTLKYNSRGRLCSPMLLQLRWYQLKELARLQVFKPSTILYRSKSKILMAIATTYQKVITQDWSPWSTHVQKKSVVLPEEFEKMLEVKGKWPDVTQTEGWYLHVKEVISNSHKEITTNDTLENDSHTVSDLPVHTTKEVIKQTPIVSNQIKEAKEPEIIELDSDDEINEILREKADNLLNVSQDKMKDIMNLSEKQMESNDKSKNIIDAKSKHHNDTDQALSKPIIEATICNNEPILCDSDDEMDKLLQEKVTLMSIEFPKNLGTLDKGIRHEVDEFKKVTKCKLGMEIKEVGIVKNEKTNKENQYESLDESDFDQNSIEFVDDGIQFEEGGESKTVKVDSRTDSSSDTDAISNSEESDVNPDIDLKLLMNNKVYTKKIDHMEVFKFIDYTSVADKRIIEYVESESKPVTKRAPEDVDIERFREQAIPGFNKNTVHLDDSTETLFTNTENRIKYTSWLLQKPRKRKYKSSQLSRNPDFNTQLKILTSGFLNSTRNKLLLKECQPLTIDLHKAFENKLIDGIMYLKRSNFKSAKTTKMENINNREFTSISPSISNILTEDQNMKLTEHVRELIATMTAASQDEGDSEMSNTTTKLPIKRSKVINLPDKDQIRLLNQSLLTAEITPRHQPLLNLSAVNTTISSDSSRIVCSSEQSPNKKPKVGSKSIEQRTSAYLYCCWAREKIVIIEENLDLDCSKHLCVDNCCTCCCRVELAALVTSKQDKLQTTNRSFTKLSNLLDVEITNSAQINRNSNAFASLIKISNGEVLDVVRKSTQKSLSDGKSDDTKSINDTNIQDKQVASENKTTNKETLKVLDYMFDSNNPPKKKDEDCTWKKVYQRGIPLFKKIETKSPVKENPPCLAVNTVVNSESTRIVVVPPGVNYIRLTDGKLALAISPGVKLKPEKLHSLMSICASANSTLNEETNNTNKEPPNPPLHFTEKLISSSVNDPIKKVTSINTITPNQQQSKMSQIPSLYCTEKIHSSKELSKDKDQINKIILNNSFSQN